MFAGFVTLVLNPTLFAPPLTRHRLAARHGLCEGPPRQRLSVVGNGDDFFAVETIKPIHLSDSVYDFATDPFRIAGDLKVLCLSQ